MSTTHECAAAPQVIGIDIGGANLKFSGADQQGYSQPFAMWKQYADLRDFLAAGVEAVSTLPVDYLAITMTGELADCFATRRAGVAHIAEHASAVLGPDRTRIYAVDGAWHSPPEAVQHTWKVAASNWHALASWVAGLIRPAGERPHCLLVDIGSTTVDIIPIRDGRLATTAKTDRERLQAGQLVYTGYERTSVASMVDQVFVDEQCCPVMAEHFADSLDAYLALGLVEEQPHDLNSADGRGRTRRLAQARLARLVGEDGESLSQSVLESIAAQIIEAQVERIVDAISRVVPADQQRYRIVFSGHGAALAAQIQQRLLPQRFEFQRLQEYVSESASRCAPAVAVRALLTQHLAGARVGHR